MHLLSTTTTSLDHLGVAQSAAKLRNESPLADGEYDILTMVGNVPSMPRHQHVFQYQWMRRS